jgi:hypothetical protein
MKKPKAKTSIMAMTAVALVAASPSGPRTLRAHRDPADLARHR